jgi:hypothetical protein
VSARLHLESVDLGLDLDVLGGVGLQPCDVNLDIEVTDAAILAQPRIPCKRRRTWRR